jgi:hypothetical protein
MFPEDMLANVRPFAFTEHFDTEDQLHVLAQQNPFFPLLNLGVNLSVTIAALVGILDIEVVSNFAPVAEAMSFYSLN